MKVHNDCDKKQHPKDKANILSLLTFAYMLGIFSNKFKKNLPRDGFYRIPRKFETGRCRRDFEAGIAKAKLQYDNPSVLTILWCKYRWKYFFIVLPYFLIKIARSIIEPELVSSFISYFKEKQTKISFSDATFSAVAQISLTLLYIVIWNQFCAMILEFSLTIRSGMASLIYRKALKLPQSLFQKGDVGNIVTLLTKDMALLEAGIIFSINFIITASQVLVTCYLIYKKIGNSAYFGFIFFLVVIICQCKYIGREVAISLKVDVLVLLGVYATKIRIFVDNKSSERIKSTQEAITSLKIIKMLCWESYFMEKIANLRRIEVNGMLKDAYAKSMILVLGAACPDLMVYLFISGNFWLGLPLTTEQVFYIVNSVKNLKMMISLLLPFALGSIADLRGSVKRIDTILQADEIPQKFDEFADDPKIYLKNVTVNIGGKPVLSNVSMNVKSGITCLVGPLGSGKTTLLLTILKEIAYRGIVLSRGRISYAGQVPWLFPGSIKENIVFEEEFCAKRYCEVVEICGLLLDFKGLEDGDDTIVVNGGQNLSKGQQSRINLARALYKDSEIYLIDDCFSVLDDKMQGHIFANLKNGFLKDKVCLLVTQNMGFVTSCNRIKLGNGGVYEDSLDNNHIVDCHDLEDHYEDIDENRPLLSTNIFYNEMRKERHIPFKVYWKYVKYGRGVTIFIIILGLLVGSEFLEGFSTKSLTKWVDLEQKKLLVSQNTTIFGEIDDNSRSAIKLYTTLLIASIIVTLIKVCTFFDFTKEASKKINNELTFKILRAKLSFFNTHYIGSILNVFSQDLNNIDEHMPIMALNSFRGIITLVSISVILCIVNWKLLSFISLLIITSIVLRQLYIAASRNLKRIETITRSPFIGHINSSIEGVTTIRAHNVQNQHEKKFDQLYDSFSAAAYTWQIAETSFYFYLDIWCLMFISSLLFAFLFVLRGISAGNVGLAIIQLTGIRGLLSSTIRSSIQMESDMTSLERIIGYMRQEPESIEGVRHINWPNQGAIKFENVSMSYFKSKPVLKNINFEIKPGQKVGIMGRTGCGKSTLISLIFKLFDYEGVIKIDDVDIKRISIEQLRSSLDIIPQDPLILSDTVRKNMDPFGKYPDEEIWDVIRKLKLDNILINLDQPVDKNQFSAGEKQLVCLGRAMLRKNKILIMDEATANVDLETEEYLVNVIEEHFADYTVINIVHKLNCLRNYDRVIVLDAGEIKNQ